MNATEGIVRATDLNFQITVKSISGVSSFLPTHPSVDDPRREVNGEKDHLQKEKEKTQFPPAFNSIQK